MTPRITRGGLALMLQAHGLEDEDEGIGINFTRIALGNGEAPEDYMVLENLQNQRYTVEIDSITREEEDSYVEIQGVFSNLDVNAAFEWTEVGIFCTNPNSTQEEPLDEVLYAYAHYNMTDEVTACATIPKSGQEVFEILLKYRVYVGELENVTATIAESSNYASKAELTEHVEDYDNPHHVTAEQIGLDAGFLNRSVNDMTVTYDDPEPSATVTAIESGEKMTVVFAKIKTAITALISHLTNKNNPHEVTYTQVGAAAASHNHSAANITSGTLSVARGGTGKEKATAGALLKGNGTDALAELSGTGAVYATTKNVPTFGTLPASCGGTGQTTLQAARNAMGLGDTLSALPAANGGTGQTSLQATRNAMGLGDTLSALPVANGGTGNTSVDSTPTANSTKMCTSGGIKTAIDACVKKTMFSYNSTTKTLTITTT